MRRPRTTPLLLPLLLAGGVLTGCSGDDDAATASAPSSGPPAVCSSVEDLQASMTALTEVPVTVEGIRGLPAVLAAVRADVEQVVQDGQDQFRPQTDALAADATALQSAVDTAVATPSGGAVATVVSSVNALAEDVTALASDVSSTC